jgi:serine/threonine protein kinase
MRCVVKSTDKRYVDFDALQTLVGKRVQASYQATSVSIATPLKIWTEGDRVCELHPFLEGMPLDDVLARNRYRLGGSYLGNIFDRTARALADLHALGILHRDVTPSNMLLMGAGDIVLIDISYACREDHQGKRRVYNPGFSAPEQKSGTAVPQSDFYSLAATVCFLANGEAATTANPEMLLEQIRNIDFGAFALQNYRGREIIYKLLSQDVNDRPKSYRELRLTPGTFPEDTPLLGVFDLDRLGFLVLSPWGMLIGSKDQVMQKLREIDSKSIENKQLAMDVKSFVKGENPWLAL